MHARAQTYIYTYIYTYIPSTLGRRNVFILAVNTLPICTNDASCKSVRTGNHKIQAQRRSHGVVKCMPGNQRIVSSSINHTTCMDETDRNGCVKTDHTQVKQTATMSHLGMSPCRCRCQAPKVVAEPRESSEWHVSKEQSHQS